MMKSVLVANRGEIACRIFRTAKKLGIRSVAVYSDIDRDAPHVSMADESYYIGANPALESYLSIEKIIAACKATGAESVHPGYGFLSERYEFVEALQKEGIIFIGPNAHAVRVLGDKIASKKIAKNSGVSTVPGGSEAISDLKQAEYEAISAGFPVLLKASAGGGGRGMRVVERLEDVSAAYNSTRAEAKAAFGDDRVFIEKFIVQPRHIEIQVMGDKFGNVIYLGERECSIQRRHQKLIEEAPSPFISEITRQKMGEQAIMLAKAVGYDSAGTVEFIVDKDQNFYFLEMNTRLQVEHPVTECVTGLDLVELMFKSAANQPLNINQSDIKLNGHSIEVRLCAEDPSRMFLPATGRIHSLNFPDHKMQTHDNYKIAHKGTIRIDTGIEAGSEVSVFYDSLLAKIITHAPNRAQAIETQIQALNETFVEGVKHTGPFLNHVMHHTRFRSGDFSTMFIAEEFSNGFTPIVPSEIENNIFILVSSAIDRHSNCRRQHISGQLVEDPYYFPTKRVVHINGLKSNVTVSGTREAGIVVELDNKTYEIDTNYVLGKNVWQGKINDQYISMQVQRILNGYNLSMNGTNADVFVYTHAESDASMMMLKKIVTTDDNIVRSPMPGLLKQIFVEEKQKIFAGDILCIIEAMKMENQVRASHDAIVYSIKVNSGDIVSVDSELMTLEKADR